MRPSSEAVLQETVDAYQRYGSQVLAAQALGVAQSTLSRRLKDAAQQGMLIDHLPAMPGYKIKKLSTQEDELGQVTKRFIQQTQEAGEQFELPEGHVVKGVSALVDADGRVTQQWIKTKTDSIVPDLTRALKEAFESYEGVAPVIAAPVATDAELLSVYPIADQHVGLLSWGQETGEDYDLKIGVDRLRLCMAQLVTQSRPSRNAIVLNLGDWQHTDDAKNMTPRGGNILDVDSRYFKILTAGVQLMMDCIDLALTKHEHVLVRNLPGNHDPHASIALTVALGAFYSKNPRVTIDDDPSDFFFHRFGKTLMGATHGHKMRPDRMAMTLATRCRADWGATDYHWFLFGHIHHETLKEVGDVRCESFQTLAAKDAYSAGAGYNSGQSLQCVTLHRSEGEIGRHRVNLPPPPAYRTPVRTS
jgi:hypothetical protein